MEVIDLSRPVVSLMIDFHIARRRNDKVVMAKTAGDLREFCLGLLELYPPEEVNILFQSAHIEGWLKAEHEETGIRSSVG